MNKGLLLAALSAILYGSLGYFGISLRNKGMSVEVFCFWRFVVSTLCLLPFLPSVIKQRRDTWRGFGFAFILGLLFYSLGAYLYFLACPYIGSGLAMVLFFTYPLFVIFITGFMQRIRPNSVTLISCALILIGCVLIAWQKDMHWDYRGVSLALFAALGYALYVAMSKNVGSPVSPLMGTFAVCLGNSLFFALLIPFTHQNYFYPLDLEVIVLVLALAIGATILPVLFLLQSLKYISPNIASMISVCEPVISMAVSYYFLKEPVTGLQILGAIPILLGASLVICYKSRGAS